MYAKLVLKNVRRSLRDYLIYIVTLTICVCLFYAFCSITSDYYHPELGVEYNMDIWSDGMKLAICGVTLCLVFLILYVNGFMIRQRQREFAMQTIMGMERRTTARLFFAETLCMGIFAIALGIASGVFASQFVTAMLFSAYGQEYRFTFALFPDTVSLTVSVFLVIFVLTGCKNVKTIRRISIMDMLHAEKKGDGDFKKSKFMPVMSALFCLAKVLMAGNAVSCLYYYYDVRFAPPVQVLYWGNLILPVLGALSFLLYVGQEKKRNLHWRKGAGKPNRTDGANAIGKPNAFLLLWMGTAVLEGALFASMPGMILKYYLPLHSGITKQCLLFLLADMVYFVCAFFYLCSSFITAWKERSPRRKYRGGNLVFYGQILEKLKTTSKTMPLISLTFILSVFLFVALPALKEWALGYLEMRSKYDIQICSVYNDVYREEDLSLEEYAVVDSFLKDEGIGTAQDCLVELYLPKAEQFHQRVKYDFPATAISLSDYNYICMMCGQEPMSLEEGEFAVQFRELVSEEERKIFAAEHPALETDAGTLVFSGKMGGTSLSENLYNSYVDELYVLPDAVCEDLLCVMTNRYLNLETPLSYVQAKALEGRFLEKYPENNEEGEGMGYYIRMKTLQVNETIGAVFVMETAMTYAGIALFIICFTVLALQLLAEAPRYRGRFMVLRNMGVEESGINALLRRQIGVWFGLPLGLAILMVTVLSVYFFQMISAQITAYIGAGVLGAQIAVLVLILAGLLSCYCVTTWVLLQRAVK